MKARSLDWQAASQNKILGRVVIDSRASAEEFIRIVKDSGRVLEAVRAAWKKGDLKPLREFQPTTTGETRSYALLQERLGLSR
jgi:hypothetical protein